MKKRIVSWALTLCMLATMVAVVPQTVPTAKAAAAAARDNCTGNHTGWKAVTAYTDFGSVSGSGSDAYVAVKSGNYYLDDDIDIDVSIRFNAGATICLNGHTMHFTRTDNYRDNITISVASTINFALCDCSEGHTGLVTAEKTSKSVNLISVNNCTFDFYGGTIKDVYAAGLGLIKMNASGATFNMYDGAKITGCTVPNNTNATNMNAVIYTRKAGGTTINMYGGEISGNNARAGIATIYNGNTFNMYGGSITDNTVVYSPIHLYLSADNTAAHGYFNMYGGVISGNSSTSSSSAGGAGAVGSRSTSSGAENLHFHMYGGTITNNHSAATTATNYAGATTNMMTGTFVFFGGTVEGDGNETSSKHVIRGRYSYPFTVNGTAMNYGGGSGSYGTNNVAAAATKNGATYTMTDQTLRVTDTVTSLTWLKDPAFQPKFVLDSDITADWLNEIAADETITLDLNGHTFTVDDEDTDITVASGGTLNIIDSSVGQTGRLMGTVNGVPYYRARTVTLTENTSDDSLATIAFDEDVTLDLNGCTYTGVISNSGKLTIQDSASGGTLLGYVTNTATGTLTQTGGVMKRVLTADLTVESVDWELGTNAIIDVYGNTLTVTNDITGNVTIIDSLGGGAFVGTLNGEPVEFGTMIVLTQDTESADLATIAAGDNVTLDLNGCTYTVTGGKITNAGELTIMDSASGGVLLGYVSNTGDGTLTQTGGVMKRVLTEDVDFATAADFDMDLGTNAIIDLAGYTLSCSNANKANNIDVYNNLTVMDSSDSTGTVSALRFMVRDGGTFTLDGGTITANNLPNGSSSGYSGQAVYIYAGGTFNMNDGEISNNRMSGTNGTKSPNGTVYVFGTFNMYGGEIKSNKARTGSGVSVPSGGVFNLYGGSVKGNSYTTMGGDVYVTAGGTINVFGGHLGTDSEGTQYVALYAASGGAHATLNVYDGHVGNIATRSGAAAPYQDVNFYGGELYSFCTSSGYYDGNFYVYGGSFRDVSKLDIPDMLATGIALGGEDLAVKNVGGTYEYQVVHTFGEEANMLLSSDMTFFMYFSQADTAWTYHSYNNGDQADVRTPTSATVSMPGRASFAAPITTENGQYKIAVPVVAKELADTVTVTFSDASGEIGSVTDSVKAYATRILSTSESETEKTLMVDMLNYGAAAQTYFSYNTGSPANADLTPEQLALATPVSLSQDANKFAHPAAYHSANLRLDQDIDFNMYFWPEKVSSTDLDYTVYKNGSSIGSGTFSKTLGDAGTLYEINIEGVTLAEVGGAYFEVEYTDFNGSTVRAKDALVNYLARNDGYDIDDDRYTYTDNETSVTITSAPGNDTSNLYQYVMAFATSTAAYAAV